jgi:hypothetical protein
VPDHANHPLAAVPTTTETDPDPRSRETYCLALAAPTFVGAASLYWIGYYETTLPSAERDLRVNTAANWTYY